MFQHPALRKNTRGQSYGEFKAYQYVVVRTPVEFSFGRASAAALTKLKPALNAANELPAGSILLVQTYSPFADYTLMSANGYDIGLDTTSNQMGAFGPADDFEDFLEDRAETLFTIQTAEYDAKNRAREAYNRAVVARAGGGSSSSAAPATTSAPAAAPAANVVLATGYYEDINKGFAIYYNAERGYIEYIAAPTSAGYKTQPKFSRGSDEFSAFEANAKSYPSLYKGAGREGRKAVLAIAVTKEGGKELPEPGSSGGSSYTPSTASSPTAPSSTAPATQVSGTPAPQTSKKKGVPAWVWWTSGTVVVAGLGVWGAIALKKRNAANQ